MSVFRFKSFAPLIALSVAALFVAGCGFTPLYSNAGTGQSGDLLASIQLDAPKNRDIQLVRNALYLTMSPGPNPLYRLTLKSRDSISNLAIERDSRVTRANFSQTVQFKLTDIKTGQTLFSGTSTRAASYNKVASEFANDQAEADARKRTSLAIAEDIRLQLLLALRDVNSQSRKKPRQEEQGK
ncbi:MAG: hypothetical protein ACON41_05140 [Parvibaculales bacterium]